VKKVNHSLSHLVNRTLYLQPIAMLSYKSLFQLPENIHYLNCAYMSPMLREVEEAGIAGIRLKRNPSSLAPADFFTVAVQVKSKFGQLINCPAEHIAIIPSASYGLAAAVQNLPTDKGDKVTVVGEEFPSAYYAAEKWCRTHGKTLETIAAPAYGKDRGVQWNEQILASISADTVAVILSTIHWGDGTLFDLVQIGELCRRHGAMLIIDGTQSVGALPFDVQAVKPDALVCAAYKWLMGPYSIGLAYYGPALQEGIPLEESWMTRSNAAEFSKLTNYVDTYATGAGRYDMGEFSNFILLPMLDRALAQLLEWEVKVIQDHVRTLSRPLIQYLHQRGWWVEDDAYRAAHLFGFAIPAHVDPQHLLDKLKAAQVHVSLRGEAIRVSFHLYNDASDVEALIKVLDQVKP
jgi:selenocysteine lyase/cysteine desulfurase